MGLRGIGAKSLASKSTTRKKKSWENPKLSAADAVKMFIPTMKLTAGEYAGKPFRLRPFQTDIVNGIYRQVDGQRVVRTALATMGRKNGKTELAAVLAAAHLFGPMAEPRGEVFSAAADRNQSGRIFKELEAMIYADADLTARCNVQRFAKKIEVLSGPGAGSTYEALSSDARKAHSLSPSFIVCDELAQWPNRDLYDNLVTGTGARKQPLVVVISTMSANPNDVMTELVLYGQQVNAGIIEDPSFVAFIYMVPMDTDVWDEANWPLANPALGDFRELDEMQKFAAQAKRIPAKEAVFRNLYMNQPIETKGALRGIPRADWDACAMSEADVKKLPELLKGRPCFGGLDLASGNNDLLSLVLAFPFEEHLIVTSKFWACEDGIADRAGRDRAPYPLWAKQGHLSTSPGRVLDYDYVAKDVADAVADYDLKAIACDPWQLKRFNQSLSKIGADHIKLLTHGQSFSDFDPAIRALDELALKWTLRHDANPIMAWCNDNVRIVLDPAGNRKYDKSKSTGRIDGIVALAMAVNLASTQQGKEPQFQMLVFG